jgi:hypothetical protein
VEVNPDSIRQELFQVGRELSKAADAIQGLEVDAERAELKAQSDMDRVYLTAEGPIEDRKALAREKAIDSRDSAFVARAAYNRARAKAKHLELSQMRLMATLKSVQLECA